MSKKWLILSSDFKPMQGGVAEFTFQIASILSKKGLLEEVITSVEQNQIFDFSVRSPNLKSENLKRLFSSLFHQKNKYLKSIRFRLFLLKAIFIIFTRQEKCLFLFCFVDNLLAYRLIKICLYFKVDFIVLFHGKEIIRFAEKDLDFLKQIEKFSSRIIFNSHSTKKLFQEHINSKKLEVPFSIWHPTVRFDYLDKLAPEKLEIVSGLPEGALLISSICRLVRRKGLHFAAKAFLSLDLDGEFKNTYYLIAGDGPEKQALRDLIAQRKDRVIFLGSITDSQKKELLLRSYIFLMPNYSVDKTDFEGFGISFIEAAYFGNIVLGGNSGGAAEAVGLCPEGHLIDTDVLGEKSIGTIADLLQNKLRLLHKGEASLNTEHTREILREKLDLTKDINSLIES